MRGAAADREAPLPRALSPSNLPQSSTERLDVRIIDARSWRRIMTSSKSSVAVAGNLRMPRSSLIKSGPALSRQGLLARASNRGVGQLVKQQMRFAIQYPMAKSEVGLSKRLSLVIFGGAGRARAHRVCGAARACPRSRECDPHSADGGPAFRATSSRASVLDGVRVGLLTSATRCCPRRVRRYSRRR